MESGTIILPRAVLETPLWRDAGFWRLWTWCLLAAGRRARMVTVGGVPARLAAGELAVTPENLARATGLSAAEVRRCLAFGKNIGRLLVRSTFWGLRITVVNWQEYRRPDPAPAGTAGR
jgi:hypothetical protein